MASQYDTRHTQTELSSPAVETLLGVYGPKLSGILGGNINTASFAPAVAAQNQAQQQAMQTAFGQQGFTYDPATGAVGGSGIAAFQPYLDSATSAANQIQGAGQAALGMAAGATNQMQGLAAGRAISGAATPFQQQAAADLAGARGLTGSGAGTGIGSIQDYMSPYQQQVIDAALADFDLDTQRQQQQLGMQQAMSGTMTGSRAGAAAQELGSSRGMDRALLQANMLNQGFQQAQAARQQDIANRMGISSQTAALGESAAGLTGQDISALGQVGQTQGQLAQSQMSPFTQALAAQTQMAQLVPKLGAQQFGVLQAFGDQNQKYAQAGMDALAQKNKLEQYAPYEQLGFVGQQISGLMGGYGTGTSIGTTAGPQASPGESTFGNFMQGAGILANLGGMFGLGG